MSKWTLSPPTWVIIPEIFHRRTKNIVTIYAVAAGGLIVDEIHRLGPFPSSSRQLEKFALVVGDVLVRAQSVDFDQTAAGY